MWPIWGFRYVIGPDQSAKNDADSKHYSHLALPASKHSTFGVGQTAPAKDAAETTDDGVMIPLGKGGPSGASSSLLYNEYSELRLVLVSRGGVPAL